MCTGKPRRTGYKWHLKIWFTLAYWVLHPYCSIGRHDHS